MSNRRDFIRNTLFGIAASILPKILQPTEIDMADKMTTAHLKMQSLVNKEVPPGTYIVFENGVWMRKSHVDKLRRRNDKQLYEFLKNSPHNAGNSNHNL